MVNEICEEKEEEELDDSDESVVFLENMLKQEEQYVRREQYEQMYPDDQYERQQQQHQSQYQQSQHQQYEMYEQQERKHHGDQFNNYRELEQLRRNEQFQKHESKSEPSSGQVAESTNGIVAAPESKYPEDIDPSSFPQLGDDPKLKKEIYDKIAELGSLIVESGTNFVLCLEKV